MKFTDLFIRRWVLATALNLVILIVGLRAWTGMTIRQYPHIVSTLVTVNTAYPGASPATVQGFITSRLEQAIAQAPNIDYMLATSAESVSTISVYMKLNSNPNADIAQILAKVKQVASQLPPASQAPVINETVGNPRALMYLAFYSKTMNQQQINDYLLRVVQPRMQAIPGVAQAQILPPGTGSSGNSFALRAWLNPVRMAAYGLSPANVASALATNDYISAVGRVRGKNIAQVITATTSLNNRTQFRNLIVKSNVDGVPIRLKDVAQVKLGAQNYNSAVFLNGIPAVFIGIQTTPDANSLKVAHAAHQVLASIIKKLPPGLKARIGYDASIYIKAAIHEVLVTILITLAIVVAVVFLFLGSLRALLIPAVAIPLSIIGAGIFMLASGFTINLLTLLAVILAIGLVVDDAIIIVENIHRHIDEGLKPLQAARRGARELASPIIVMSTTLAAVFAPIGFLGGLTGSLFTEFAFTLVFTVLISMIVALTLSPMLSSKLLKPTREHGLVHFLDAVFTRLRAGYDRTLRAVLNYRIVVLIIAAAILATIPFLFLGTQHELAPTEDQGVLFFTGTGPPTATRHYMNIYSRQILHAAQSFPQTQAVFQVTGFSFVSPGQNTLVGGMILKPWNQRKRTQMQIAPLFQRKLARIAGVQVASFSLPSIPGAAAGYPIQFVITSTHGYLRINQLANELIAKAMASGKFLFLTKDLRYDSPQIKLVIHRNIAADLGLNMTQVGLDLESLLGGNFVNRFDLAGRSYKVIPQAPAAWRATPSMLKDYYVHTPAGAMVPLSTFVSIKHVVQPEFLPQFQQLNSATVQGVSTPGVPLGTALAYLKTLARKILPNGFGIDYAGQSPQFIQQGGAIYLTFALAIIMIFLLMAAQFESFRDPLIVLFTVPMSIFGAMIFLFLGVATLNIYTEVGLITLIGLITKQGVLIVQFANQLQEQEGLDRRAAVIKASSIRLRPILMTTGAMVFGVVPLLLASGAGAVSRFDIGLMIASGLAIGCLFSLYVVPVMYTYLATRKEKIIPAGGESPPRHGIS